MFTDWRPTGGEVFRILGTSYDVDEAKRILAAKPREAGTIQGSALNHPLIMGGKGEIDMTVPVILATMRGGSHLPIDGWTRIKEAVCTDSSVLYVILTRKETLKIERRG